MKLCSVCHTSFEDDATFCPRDGEVLQEAPETMVGRVLDGKYEVESFIAQGGMGAVYLARHILLGDRVVIKTLRSEMRSNAEWLRRFRREGQAARAFRHPNSVTVYDLSAGPDGLVYMVMEYVEGHTLDADLKRRGRLAPREALEVLEPVADVLDAAHARGVVHRDLKPENIMLGRDERGAWFVKVLDLGIAKIVGGDDFAAGATALTVAGQILGTPYYMSPEQWGELPRDGRAEVDGRTDVYSLGVIVFELVAGRKPLSGRTLAELRQQHVSEPTPSLAEAAPDVTAEFARAVARATAKDRADRPATAGEFIDELRAALGLPLRSRHAARAYDLGPGPEARPSSPPVEEAATARLAPGALATGAAGEPGRGGEPTLLTSDLDDPAAVGARRGPAARTSPAGHDARRAGGRETVASDVGETVVDAPDARAAAAPSDHAAAARPRRLAPLVAGAALLLVVVAGVGGWLAWQRARQRSDEPVAPALNPPAPAAPRVEALSYWVETFDDEEDKTGERVAELTTALGPAQNFRLHFNLRTRGYLYLVGPMGKDNALVTLLTARGGRGLKSNAVLDEADFPYPRGGERDVRLILRGEAGAAEGYTVIFSPAPLRAPAFLAAEFGHELTPDEVGQLEELRARHKAAAPTLEVRGEGGARRVAVNVPEGATVQGEPVIFDIRLMRR